jgi:hypothetical protein
VKKLDLIVFRIVSNGKTGNARPCYNCLNMMKNIGIKKVFYSTDNKEEIISENVNNMISIQSSNVTRIIESKKTNNINRETYYESLLKKYFPVKVKKKNLYCFVNYNFKNIFPNYIVNINIKKNIVMILNESNNLILKSHIIL